MKKLALGLVMALMLTIGMLVGSLLTKTAQAQGNPPKDLLTIVKPTVVYEDPNSGWVMIQLGNLDYNSPTLMLFDNGSGNSWWLKGDAGQYYWSPLVRR